MAAEEHPEIAAFLHERGYSNEYIAKILAHLDQFDSKVKRESFFDAMATGELDLDSLVKDAEILIRPVILLVDNYDSFVYNLARYLERLGQQVRVVRNDAIDVAGVAALQPAAIVLSPGPCSPSEAGCSLEIVLQLHQSVPILGICLGHQAIGAALGGRVVRAAEPMHGRASNVYHTGRSVFAGLPSPLVGCRYHSLVVEEASLPSDVEVTARTADGIVMALEHRRLPIVGLQFHPESILTEHGYALLAGFLRLAGLKEDSSQSGNQARQRVLPTIDDELLRPTVKDDPRLHMPVTF